MRGHVKARVEATLAADAAAERDRVQATILAVAPLMVDTGVLAGVAENLAPDHGAAMGAAIDQSVDRAVRVTIDDDRSVADISGSEITGIRYLGFEPKKIPDRAAEDPLLFTLVRFGIVIKAVWHAAVVQGRPDPCIQHSDPPNWGEVHTVTDHFRTSSRRAFRVVKINRYSFEALVIYRPPSSAACRDQL